jgi:hypothetical protein
MIIVNTKDMINVFKGRMKVLSEFAEKRTGKDGEELGVPE